MVVAACPTQMAARLSQTQQRAACRQLLAALYAPQAYPCGAQAGRAYRRRSRIPSATSSATGIGALAMAADSDLELAEQQRRGGTGVSLRSLDQSQLDIAVEKAVQRLQAAGLGSGGGDLDTDQASLSRAIHRVVEEEVHAAFETELAAVHDAFEQEMSTAKQTVKDAVDAALHEQPMKFDVTANVNTVMAITAVIAYWRGVGGLLDIVFEDSLEGFVACIVFGWVVLGLIRILKLPVVEGAGL